MPTYRARPSDPRFRRDHPLMAAGGPLLALYPAGRGTTDARDPTGAAWATSGVVTPRDGPYGPAWGYDPASGSSHQNTTAVLPATATVLLALCAPTQAGTGSTFRGGDDAERIQAFLPYDGILYWDFGLNSGPNRLTWTPPSDWFGPYTWHTLALRAGALGSAMWSDGIKVASSATGISRANVASTPGLTVGTLGAFFSDTAVASLELYAGELPDATVSAWAADPYAHVRRRSPPAVLAAAAGAGSGGGGATGPVLFHSHYQNMGWR